MWFYRVLYDGFIGFSFKGFGMALYMALYVFLFSMIPFRFGFSLLKNMLAPQTTPSKRPTDLGQAAPCSSAGVPRRRSRPLKRRFGTKKP